MSRLGIGGSRIGSIGNPVPMPDMRKMLARAFELGVNVLDTADIYGQGDSEREIGKAIRGRRETTFLITKGGQRFSAKMRLIRYLKPLFMPIARRSDRARARVVSQRSSTIGVDFSPKHLTTALEASLRRLGVDYVDAYLLHGPTLQMIEDNAITDVLMQARERGLIRHFGVSCDDMPTARRAAEIDGVVFLQLPVNLLEDPSDFRGDSVAILAREVIRLNPQLTPLEAVQRYALRKDIDCTIVGVSTAARLDQLAKVAEVNASLS